MPVLDPSWSAIVTLASAEHWQFGRQIMLNYGPLSHLGIGYFSPELFAENYIFQIISKALLVAMILRVSLALPRVGRVWFLIANTLAGLWEWEALHLLSIGYTGLLLCGRDRRDRVLGYVALALVVATALMKTFFLVFAVGVLGCVVARRLLENWPRFKAVSLRTAFLPAGVFLALFCAAWVLSGQPLVNLPVYLQGALELTSGHTHAMSYPPAPEVLWMGLGILLMSGSLMTWLLAKNRGKLVAALPLAALLTGGLFMAWKQGYTRADSYHVPVFVCYSAVSVLALPRFFERRRPAAPALYYLSVAIVWALGGSILAEAKPQAGEALWQTVMARWQSNPRILLDPAEEKTRLESITAALRDHCALPAIRAAVGRARIDVFGTEQAIALLNNLNYSPVPTLQGFLAYTPYLSTLNLRCYDPDRAPEYVLFKLQPIDNRWPALDGAAQLRVLLQDYRFVLAERGYMLLRHKAPVLATARKPVMEQEGALRLGERLELTPSAGDWCELEVRDTALGKFLSFLYQHANIEVEATMANGARGRWQLPPVMARSGFLLRQGPRSSGDVLRLLAGQSLENPVVAIRLVDAPRLRWFFQPRVKYRFYRLPSEQATATASRN